MGLKWFDYVGHAAVGAMDKDAEIRKEQLDRRFKELDENKTMYRALASTRYSKDLNKFEEETKKYDSLKSVYANIENNNYHPNEIMAEYFKFYTLYHLGLYDDDKVIKSEGMTRFIKFLNLILEFVE